MFHFSVFDLLIVWLDKCYELSLCTFEYPFQNYFRKDSLFSVGYYEGEWFLELFFNIIIGEKKYE